MSVEIGTATDYLDLQQKLKTFLTTDATLVGLGQEWVCTMDVDNEQRYTAPGLSGAEEIFVGIRAYADVPTDVYNWEIGAFLSGNLGADWESQAGWAANHDSYVPLWDQSIPYWFIANGQRLILIAHVNTTYSSFYFGKFLPYATPNQYPYPVCYLGMMYTPVKYSVVATAYNFFPRVSSYSWLYAPDGASVGGSVAVTPAVASFSISPFLESYNSTATITSKLAPFDNGDLVLVPNVIQRGAPSGSVAQANYGELDGVYYVSGVGQTSGTIINANGFDHLVVQDGAEVALNSFMAVRLV